MTAAEICLADLGGAGGSVVASRLSENPRWKVLLVEAGPDEPAGAQIPSNLQLYLSNFSISPFSRLPPPSKRADTRFIRVKSSRRHGSGLEVQNHERIVRVSQPERQL